MTKRTNCLAAAAISVLGALGASSAQAAYVAIFQEIGANVEEVGGGTLNVTDLTQNQTLVITPGVRPEIAVFQSGASGQSSAYEGIGGPSNFGTGAFTPASSSSGDGVALLGQSGALLLPLNYQSDDPLSETSTYLNSTFASLGMTPGTYVWKWGSGDHADSFTIQIGEVPEPSTWAMMLLGFVGLGYAAIRRKGVVRAVSAVTD